MLFIHLGSFLPSIGHEDSESDILNFGSLGRDWIDSLLQGEIVLSSLVAVLKNWKYKRLFIKTRYWSNGLEHINQPSLTPFEKR